MFSGTGQSSSMANSTSSSTEPDQLLHYSRSYLTPGLSPFVPVSSSSPSLPSSSHFLPTMNGAYGLQYSAEDQQQQQQQQQNYNFNYHQHQHQHNHQNQAVLPVPQTLFSRPAEPSPFGTSDGPFFTSNNSSLPPIQPPSFRSNPYAVSIETQPSHHQNGQDSGESSDNEEDEDEDIGGKSPGALLSGLKGAEEKERHKVRQRVRRKKLTLLMEQIKSLVPECLEKEREKVGPGRKKYRCDQTQILHLTADFIIKLKQENASLKKQVEALSHSSPPFRPTNVSGTFPGTLNVPPMLAGQIQGENLKHEHPSFASKHQDPSVDPWSSFVNPYQLSQPNTTTYYSTQQQEQQFYQTQRQQEQHLQNQQTQQQLLFEYHQQQNHQNHQQQQQQQQQQSTGNSFQVQGHQNHFHQFQHQPQNGMQQQHQQEHQSHSSSSSQSVSPVLSVDVAPVASNFSTTSMHHQYLNNEAYQYQQHHQQQQVLRESVFQDASALRKRGRAESNESDIVDPNTTDFNDTIAPPGHPNIKLAKIFIVCCAIGLFTLDPLSLMSQDQATTALAVGGRVLSGQTAFGRSMDLTEILAMSGLFSVSFWSALLASLFFPIIGFLLFFLAIVCFAMLDVLSMPDPNNIEKARTMKEKGKREIEVGQYLHSLKHLHKSMQILSYPLMPTNNWQLFYLYPLQIALQIFHMTGIGRKINQYIVSASEYETQLKLSESAAISLCIFQAQVRTSCYKPAPSLYYLLLSINLAQMLPGKPLILAQAYGSVALGLYGVFGAKRVYRFLMAKAWSIVCQHKFTTPPELTDDFSTPSDDSDLSSSSSLSSSGSSAESSPVDPAFDDSHSDADPESSTFSFLPASDDAEEIPNRERDEEEEEEEEEEEADDEEYEVDDDRNQMARFLGMKPNFLTAMSSDDVDHSMGWLLLCSSYDLLCGGKFVEALDNMERCCNNYMYSGHISSWYEAKLLIVYTHLIRREFHLAFKTISSIPPHPAPDFVLRWARLANFLWCYVSLGNKITDDQVNELAQLQSEAFAKQGHLPKELNALSRGFMSWMYFHSKRYDEALKEADDALKSLMDERCLLFPGWFFFVACFLTDVYIGIWRREKLKDSPDPQVVSHMVNSVYKASQALLRISRGCDLTWPYYYLCFGKYHLMKGNLHHARQNFTLALGSAAQLNLEHLVTEATQYEQRTARVIFKQKDGDDFDLDFTLFEGIFCF